MVYPRHPGLSRQSFTVHVSFCYPINPDFNTSSIPMYMYIQLYRLMTSEQADQWGFSCNVWPYSIYRLSLDNWCYTCSRLAGVITARRWKILHLLASSPDGESHLNILGYDHSIDITTRLMARNIKHLYVHVHVLLLVLGLSALIVQSKDNEKGKWVHCMSSWKVHLHVTKGFSHLLVSQYIEVLARISVMWWITWVFSRTRSSPNIL